MECLDIELTKTIQSSYRDLLHIAHITVPMLLISNRFYMLAGFNLARITNVYTWNQLNSWTTKEIFRLNILKWQSLVQWRLYVLSSNSMLIFFAVKLVTLVTFYTRSKSWTLSSYRKVGKSSKILYTLKIGLDAAELEQLGCHRIQMIPLRMT